MTFPTKDLPAVVLFQVRGVNLPYKVWLEPFNFAHGNQWWWEAGGFSGWQDSRADAELDARRWLRDGVKSLRREAV